MQPLILMAALGLGVGVSAGAAQYTLLVHDHSQERAQRPGTGATGRSGGNFVIGVKNPPDALVLAARLSTETIRGA
ncbi:MAG: hypothetical protein K2Y35_00265 [Burkholderiales bacterium]|nr:hypothetical protein [Burkholderiales bacterium]